MRGISEAYFSCKLKNVSNTPSTCCLTELIELRWDPKFDTLKVNPGIKYEPHRQNLYQVSAYPIKTKMLSKVENHIVTHP